MPRTKIVRIWSCRCTVRATSTLDSFPNGNWHASIETCASDLPIACCTVQSISEVRRAAAFSDSLFADDDGETSDEDLDDDDSFVLAKSRRSTLHPPKHTRYAAGFSDSSADDDDDDDGDNDDDAQIVVVNADEELDDGSAGIPAPRVDRPSGGGTSTTMEMPAGTKGLLKPLPGNKASKKKTSGPKVASKASKKPSGPPATSRPPRTSARRRARILELKTKVRTRS